jgi:thiamine biosynthesis protein ThiS
LNPRIPESQPGALTTWLRSPAYLGSLQHILISNNLLKMKIKAFSFDIFLNGKIYSFQTYKLFSLDNLRAFLNYKKNLIVIEYKGKIIHPNTWSSILLKDLDKIEILTIVGGG